MYPSIIPTWKDLTYTSFSKGVKPHLTYHPANPKERATIESIYVSVSHDGEYVFSQVLVEGAQIANCGEPLHS
jgi:holo-[acyl-carrier protein] synthase